MCGSLIYNAMLSPDVSGFRSRLLELNIQEGVVLCITPHP